MSEAPVGCCMWTLSDVEATVAVQERKLRKHRAGLPVAGLLIND